MKKIKLNHGILLTLLALVFTLGLTFASVELPRLVDTLLHKNIDFLDVATGQDELTAYKTEIFLSHYHIRLSSEQVRRAVVFALQNFKAEKVINAIRAATNDSDMEVRMYAREALKKIDFQVK